MNTNEDIHVKMKINLVWWYIPVVPELRRLMHQDYCRFETTLFYKVSSMPVWITEWDPASKDIKYQKKRKEKRKWNEKLAWHWTELHSVTHRLTQSIHLKKAKGSLIQSVLSNNRDSLVHWATKIITFRGFGKQTLRKT